MQATIPAPRPSTQALAHLRDKIATPPAPRRRCRLTITITYPDSDPQVLTAYPLNDSDGQVDRWRLILDRDGRDCAPTMYEVSVSPDGRPACTCVTPHPIGHQRCDHIDALAACRLIYTDARQLLDGQQRHYEAYVKELDEKLAEANARADQLDKEIAEERRGSQDADFHLDIARTTIERKTARIDELTVERDRLADDLRAAQARNIKPSRRAKKAHAKHVNGTPTNHDDYAAYVQHLAARDPNEQPMTYEAWASC
jgi:uncharacterized short protein YbdD (DUF466 family)